MRKIIGAAFMSLDGVMQAPGGPTEDTTGGFAYGGWMEPLIDEAVGQRIDTLFKSPFDLLLGRRTYDIFAAHWPYAPADDPIAAKFAKANKYVLTGSNAPLGWKDSHRLADLDALANVKADGGPDLVIQGSSTLYPQLLARGLLERLVLMMAPVTLGAGKRLFGDGVPPGTFRLTEQQLTPSGWIIASYEPAGPVQTGSFAMAKPSEAERVRQAKIKAGSW